MKYKLFEVEFKKNEFYVVRKSLESVMIDGFKPTKQSVQDIKDLLYGYLTVESLAKKHYERVQKTSLNKK